MKSYATILPLRFHSEEQEKSIEYFFTLLSITGLFLVTFLPVTINLSVGNIFFTTTTSLLIGEGLATLLVIYRQWRIKRTIAKAKFVYQYGDAEELTFSGSSSNYGFKVNGAPQTIITVLIKGKLEQVKSFNANVITVYSLPRQTAYTHPEYPGTVVPSGLFGLQRGEQRSLLSVFLRRALVFGVPLAFVIGLSYLISGDMDSHSHAYAQLDALVYRQDGKLVLATAVTSFKAYKVSSSGTYGNDTYYAGPAIPICEDMNRGWS